MSVGTDKKGCSIHVVQGSHKQKRIERVTAMKRLVEMRGIEPLSKVPKIKLSSGTVLCLAYSIPKTQDKNEYRGAFWYKHDTKDTNFHARSLLNYATRKPEYLTM